jgi:hypothetical protein
MKKILLSLAMVTIIGLVSISAQKGSAFKGTINYKVSTPEANVQGAVPQDIKVILSGNKARIEMTMAAINQIIILDSDAQTTVALLDVMGQKIALKPKRSAERLNREPIVEVTTETKEIAGYLCKKANIHYGDEQSKANPTVVYFTDQIGNNKIFYDNEYRTLPGIPMEFNFKMQGMSMQLVASSVEKGKVSNKDFEIPSDYKETTPEELRQMFGGN